MAKDDEPKMTSQRLGMRKKQWVTQGTDDTLRFKDALPILMAQLKLSVTFVLNSTYVLIHNNNGTVTGLEETMTTEAEHTWKERRFPETLT